MISDEGLLQANATVIAGILIFLTISPMSRGIADQLSEKKSILYSTYFTLASLITSVAVLLFGPLLSLFSFLHSPCC
jgi:ABC-type polysaccharide/polyol phosphate export permease